MAQVNNPKVLLQWQTDLFSTRSMRQSQPPIFVTETGPTKNVR